MKFQQSAFLFFLILIFSCSQQDDSFYAENVPSSKSTAEYNGHSDYLTDLGTLRINVTANANHPGQNLIQYLKNIQDPNFAYCHPDVQYFPNGFNGYKYWMVFTPYFGAVGTTLDSKRYENPTIVVSNDGINWNSPSGISNPIQLTPSQDESLSDNPSEPKQGFWSDVDWMYENGRFYLYYRGCFIKASALLHRGAKSNNNLVKLLENAQRTIVRQTSIDGIKWTPLEVAYTSNPQYSPKNNHILSPSFIYNGKEYVSFEVENNISNNFPGKDPSYIIRRTSKNGLDFSKFKESKIVNLINKPWLKNNPEYSPWHLQASYIDGYYFLCLAVGNVTKFTADALYLAVSEDGLNFKVLPKPMVEHNVYRSCIFPMQITDDTIDFGAVIAYKTGIFKYREFQLSKEKLDNFLH